MEKPLTYPLEKVSEPVRFSMLFETKTRKIQSGPKKPAGVLNHGSSFAGERSFGGQVGIDGTDGEDGRGKGL
jgi:hypothetical protein